MISLDIDFSYLQRCFNIGYQALEKYRNKSITEIMEIEAEQGNYKAAEYLMKILSDPDELLKLFNLVEPKNRYLILQHMNKEDLMNIMPFMQPEQLVLGISVFNPDMIINLMMLLKPESLAKVVLNTMSPEKFLSKLPEEFMNEFLMSDKLDKNILLKSMENVDEIQLQKMMENISGQPCYDSSDKIISQLSSMDDDNFKSAILSFEPEGKRQLIYNSLRQKPELFQLFSPEAMVFPFRTMQKDDILKSLLVLETNEFMPMLQQMPQDILSLVATQIDPETFSEILCRDFADVIAQCGISM